MISAATAAVAVPVIPFVREHGVEYLFAATARSKSSGYNRASADIADKFALHDKTGFELGAAAPH